MESGYLMLGKKGLRRINMEQKMLNKRKSIYMLIIFLFVFPLAIYGCDAVGELPGMGEGGATLPVQPDEPVQEPTQAPPEPQPTVLPEQPQEPAQPPDTGGSTGITDESLENIIRILLIIIVIGIVLGAIVFIISLLTRPKTSTETSPVVSAPVRQTGVTEPVTENTHLKNASPEVAELYRRFVELVKAYGPVSIVPTETRIDFQARSIFASVQFRLESLEIQLVMPRIVQDSKIIRVDTLGTDKYSHLVMIDSLDDYDAEFNTWLKEAYDLGS